MSEQSKDGGPATLADRIATLRSKRGVSLQGLAVEVGVTKTHIWDLEKGRADNPTLRTLVGLCQSLNCTLEFLAGLSTWRSADTAPAAGFFLAWSPDFPDLVACWKAELFHAARRPGTPKHLGASHFTKWMPVPRPAPPATGA
jgi:transcriptional regulator with XRE-family HTH domain